MRTIPKVVMAPAEEFDKEWDDFLKGLEDLGAEKYEKYMTEQVRKMVEFWNQ